VELINATKMPAEYTLGLDPDGRERVVVVVKGTFTLPLDGSQPELAEEQVPLVMADEFTGEPGFSAPLYESEFAPHKPRCDVVLNGSAHAPNGVPAYEMMVGVRVGPIEKFFNVVGDRVWQEDALGAQPSQHPAFSRMPISYDRAWGGVDRDPDDPEIAKAYMANPVGVGYYPLSVGDALNGQSLPNTEELGNPIGDRAGKYRPMSFGPIGRHFEPRLAYAGTYDDEWLENVFPFLPTDFDPRYFQCAPEDQQMDYPVGGEWVELTGLTPQGRTLFQIPEIGLPVEFTDQDFKREEMAAVIDTLMIEPDEGRFSMTWRASRPLRQNIFEVVTCVVGRMPRGWYRARTLGKDYYSSIHEFVAARVEEAEPA
jgi:hypothetical protein